MLRNFLGKVDIYQAGDPQFRYLPVGSYFFFDEQVLQVVAHSSCRQCAYFDSDAFRCNKPFLLPGCTSSTRADKKFVVFKRVDLSEL